MQGDRKAVFSSLSPSPAKLVFFSPASQKKLGLLQAFSFRQIFTLPRVCVSKAPEDHLYIRPLTAHSMSSPANGHR